MLAGVRVLDLSRVLAGPYCTQLLADLGADVIKIEAPGGDDTRGWGPPFVAGESAYFLSVNRGKRSVALDLRDARAAALVRRLALRSDVVVENFKVGDLARYGLDYASLCEVHPGVIYASITGFGQTGPRAREPGYDAALQAATGVMAMTGEPDRPPVKLGVAWIDVLTGVHAATGVLAALHARGASGEGAHLDLSLFEVTLASLVNQAQSALVTGRSPERLGSAHPNIVPYQAFEAADAALVVAVGNDAQFARLCAALELPDLAADARLSTNAGRVERRDLVVGALARRLRERPRAAWLELLSRAGVPATPVSGLADALVDPQTAARGTVVAARHPAVGDLPMVATPFAHLARPGGPLPRPEPVAPPLLGQHTREVLEGELGVAPAEVDALLRDGVARA